MFIRTDMVRAKIGKDTIVKGKTIYPVKHEALRGNLHDDAFAARIYHVAEILLNEIGFRRCVIRFDDFFTDNGFNRADEAGFKSGIFQNGTCLLYTSPYDSDGRKLWN